MDRPEAIDRLWVKYHVDPSLIPRSRIQVDMCDPGIAKYSARLAEVRVRETPASPDVKEANAFDDEVWWHSHREKLPHWHAAATKLFLHMPSSASVERVFSVLKNIIGDQQSNGLKDLVEGTMLINFNQRQRAAGR